MLELNPELGLVPPQVLLADAVTRLLPILPTLTHKASCFSLKTRIQRQDFHRPRPPAIATALIVFPLSNPRPPQFLLTQTLC